MTTKTFAEKLRELREAKSWTQKQLAEASGQSQQAIAHWELGDRVPAFDAVQAMCKALGVPCTIFDDCQHKPVAVKRTPGRPPAQPKTPAEGPAKQAEKPKRKRGKPKPKE